MYLILIIDILFYIAVLLLATMILGETFKLGIIVVVATVIFLIIGFLALKLRLIQDITNVINAVIF